MKTEEINILLNNSSIEQLEECSAPECVLEWCCFENVISAKDKDNNIFYVSACVDGIFDVVIYMYDKTTEDRSKDKVIDVFTLDENYVNKIEDCIEVVENYEKILTTMSALVYNYKLKNT